MEYREFQQLVFSACQARGLSSYELYCEMNSSLHLQAFDAKLNGFHSSFDAGACLRVVTGGHTGYASTSLFTAEEAASLVLRAAENAECMEKDEPSVFVENGLSYTSVSPAELPVTDSAALSNGLLRGIDALYAADPRISRASSAMLRAGTEKICLDNSNGVSLTDTGAFSALILLPVATENGETADCHSVECGSIDRINFAAAAKKAAEKAVSGLGASSPLSGKYPVVFSNDAMSSMLSTFSYAFSGENAANGLSVMKGHEDEQVAAEIVTVMDDPFYAKNPFPRTFDGEGMPTRTKAVIENGVLKTLLYDLASAAKAGKESTGNASRGVSSPVTVSPSFLYLVPGTDSQEQLLAKAGNGVLITSVGGLHAGANAVTGDFSLQSAGFMIENGKKGAPLKSFTVSGNFYEMLHHITAVADDLDPGLSRIASPSVLADELTVSGK